MEVNNWLLINLGNGGGFVLDITNWDMLFGSTLWNIWLRRNAVAFHVYSDRRESVLEASLRLQKDCLTAANRALQPAYGLQVAVDERCMARSLV
ncbi:hypothetical protein V6N11_047885 [Hibiscus sabdariffa]|uniref:RNase H type-1 domain-containing protein n=2 Tax=Hibiscus sabdariffa TaxID=183260 RepID=A0ABR1ZNK0_9ROSI